MAFVGNNLKQPGVIKKYSNCLVSFLIDEPHVRDRALIADYSACDSGSAQWEGYRYTGTGSDYIYNSGSETFTFSAGMGTYTKYTYNPKVADYRLSNSQYEGESDVLVTIKSALQEPELPKSFSGMFLYLKTSNNMQVYSDGDEVLPAFNTYSQVDTVPKDSDALFNFKTYETSQDINGDTTKESIVGGLKRFKVLELPLATELVKGFSYELYLYNEGKILDSKVVITAREDTSGEN